MGVVKHDFGLKKRRSARRFRRLLTLDALHDANIRANPLPYIERASERIYQLEKTLFEAAQAAKRPPGETASGKMIEVDEAEYRRLLECRRIVDGAAADLSSTDGEDA